MSTATPSLDSVRERLAPAVSRLQLGQRPFRARGRFHVRHGRSPLVRVISRIVGLPREGRDVPFSLEITRQAQHDVWVRRFDGRRLRTLERRGVWPPIERFGLLEFVYEADADERLTMRSISVRLRLGPVAVPLPHVLAPRDFASVEARGERAVHVSVRAELPFLGLLIAYEGDIEEVT